MRIGLVLGAGGVVGASWLIGALEALESETGFAATGADVIVGTSAGSVVGALTAAGWSAPYMSAYASGRSLDGFADLEGAAAELDAAGPAGARDRGPVPAAARPAADRAGLVAHGALDAAQPVQARTGGGHRRLAAARDDLDGAHPQPGRPVRGRRVAGAPARRGLRLPHRAPRVLRLGRPAGRAEVADAVAASCAIPAFYHPVSIGGHRYVDGGLCSLSNLDLLRHEDIDVAVCLNPMSSTAPVAGGGPAGALMGVVRGSARRRLEHETRKLEAHGVPVLTRRTLVRGPRGHGHELHVAQAPQSRCRDGAPQRRARPAPAGAGAAGADGWRTAARAARPAAASARPSSGGPRSRTSRCGFGDRRVTDTPVPEGRRTVASRRAGSRAGG